MDKSAPCKSKRHSHIANPVHISVKVLTFLEKYLPLHFKLVFVLSSLHEGKDKEVITPITEAQWRRKLNTGHYSIYPWPIQITSSPPRKKPLKSASTSLTRCLVERTEDNLSHQLHKPGKTQNLFPPTAAKSQSWKFLSISYFLGPLMCLLVHWDHALCPANNDLHHLSNG